MAMTRFYIQKGTHKGLYRSIARTLKFFQTFALVEVRLLSLRDCVEKKKKNFGLKIEENA